MWQQKAHAKVNELFRSKKMMDWPDWIGAMVGVSVTTGVTQNSNRVLVLNFAFVASRESSFDLGVLAKRLKVVARASVFLPGNNQRSQI